MMANISEIRINNPSVKNVDNMVDHHLSHIHLLYINNRGRKCKIPPLYTYYLCCVIGLYHPNFL